MKLQNGDYIRVNTISDKELKKIEFNWQLNSWKDKSGKFGRYYEYIAKDLDGNTWINTEHKFIIFSENKAVSYYKEADSMFNVVKPSNIPEAEVNKLDELYEIYRQKQDLEDEIDACNSKRRDIANYMQEFMGKVFTKSTQFYLKAEVTYNVVVSPRVLKADIGYEERRINERSVNMFKLIMDNQEEIRRNIPRDPRGKRLEMYDKVIAAISNCCTEKDKLILDKNGWSYKLDTHLIAFPSESVIPNEGEAYTLSRYGRNVDIGPGELDITFSFIRRYCERFRSLPEHKEVPNDINLDDVREAIKLSKEYIQNIMNGFDKFKEEFKVIISAREC